MIDGRWSADAIQCVRRDKASNKDVWDCQDLSSYTNSLLGKVKQ